MSESAGWCIREGGCDKLYSMCKQRCVAAIPHQVINGSDHFDPRMSLSLKEVQEKWPTGNYTKMTPLVISRL